MAKFLLLGKYSVDAIKAASADRTGKALGVIKEAGGQVESMHALLGEYDLALMVEFPGISEAVKTSLALTKLTQIAFRTLPAITVEEFDKLIG